MKILQILNLFSLLEIVYSQSLQIVGQDYQLVEKNIDLSQLLVADFGLFVGIWSRYNPLGITQQVGIVGLMDSNCFHQHSIIGKSLRSLEFIYYDCLQPESQIIQKFVSFNTLDGQQHFYKLDIQPSEYESVWYLFELLYYPQKSISEFMIVKGKEILLQKKVDTIFFKENYLKLIIGGSLIVQNSNLKSIEVGQRFSYFPGKMYQISFIPKHLSDLQLKNGINRYLFFFEDVSEIICENSITSKIPDFDLLWLDVKSFISENFNTDSFILAGWFRIIKINQVDDEFIYQFLKMSKNTRSEQLSNSNLSPFQLFYKISPNNNKIIITTYSYNFPSVTLDFTNSDNSLIIFEEFELNHKITLWHSLFVNLIQDQIFIQIKFFDQYDVYEYSISHPVKQFRFVQFQIQYGNLIQTQRNYLNIQTRNNIFYNCQQQIQQQNCHYSCEDCDGPTNTDCLSCSAASNRIYLPQHKACICPYNQLDDQMNQNCLAFSDQSFDIKDLQKDNDCKFGYFEYDDSCYPCPSIISDKLITCLECLQNVKGWKDDAYCRTMVYLNPNGNTAKTFQDPISNLFTFDGLEPQLCREWKTQHFSDIDSIFQLFSQQQEKFNFFCQNSWADHCYECNIFDCFKCSIEMTGMKCIDCGLSLPIINGQCTSQFQQPNFLKSCRTPYYLSSLKECKLCPIKNCKYCFEYNKNDLGKCTLYANFEIFEFDEYTKIGCALCEENFIFDFIIGECNYKQPSISNCLRSFVNLQNQEICTLSSTDFSIALEIINCGKLIENCLQCIFTPWQEIRCIICQIGFTTSVKRGNCYPNSYKNAIIVIDGDQTDYDAWIQRVQSFIMKFLPNQYFYQRDIIGTDNQESQILNQHDYQLECIDGYAQNQNFSCVNYCTSECLSCQENQRQNLYYCVQCPLNNYYEPIRSLTNGQCIRCPELCEVCEKRSEAEIQKLNPYFLITDDNIDYSFKCIKPISIDNVVLDPYFQIAKYCFAPNCNVEFTFKQSAYQKNSDDKIDIHYCNQIGLKVLKFQNDWKTSNIGITQITELKQLIFSLQQLKTVFNLYQNKLYFYYVSGYDSIEINDAILQANNNNYFQFKNQNQKVDIILNNIVIQQNQINNITSLFDSEIFGDVTMNNIQIINTNFNTTSLFNFNQKLLQGTIKIQKMVLQNCSIQNSQLFYFVNNQVQIEIEQLIINKTFFHNSSFITFFQNLEGESKLEVRAITITSSNFQNSYLFNCTNLQDIYLNNVILDKNSINLSTIIAFNKNFTLLQSQLNNNNFIESQFIATLETDSKKKVFCFVEKLLASQNDYTTSSLFQISNENMNYSLRAVKIQLNQGYNTQYQDSSLFNLHCFKLEIDQIYIADSNKLRIFNFFEVSQIIASNIIYENLKNNNRVPSSLNCVEFQNFNYQLLLISGYSLVTLKNIKVIKLFSVDILLIQISTRKKWTDIPSSLELINLEFIGNLLLHQNQANFFSFVQINSEHNANIQIENVLFENNFIHQQIDDPQDSAAALLHIESNQGYIKINNLQCAYNALTNSSNSFMFLKSEIITITNYTVSNHNILPLQLWKLYYDIQLENDIDEYDQEQTNLMIQQSFKILNKGGSIAASTFFCFNCFFQDFIGLKSTVFEIKTQGNGNIQLRNLTINSSEYDLSQITDSTGCITIYSSNSLLDLKIINAILINIFNRMAASVLTIHPSLQKNTVFIQDIIIKNCISLINPLINILFSTQYINSNKVIIINANINFQEGIWMKYFEKTGMLNQNEILDIASTTNALIQLQNCKVVMSKILIQGLFGCPLIKLINVSYLLIFQLRAIEIKLFYAFNLIEVRQDLQIKQTIYINYGNFQRIQIYEITENLIYQNSKINYMIQGCSQIEIQQEQATYSFSQIIKLFQQAQKVSSIIQFYTNSNNTVIEIQNVFLHQINCSYCLNGLIFFNIENYKSLKIRDLIFNSNHIKNYGCMNIEATTKINRNFIIQNSNFFNNNGSSGTAIYSSNIPINIIQCSIINNVARDQGGGIFLNMDTKYLIINKSSIINNKAFEGGGIYLFQNGNINQENLIQTFMQFNQADFLSNNLFEFPTHLSLLINSQEMQAEELIINNNIIQVLKLKSYQILDQGVIKFSNYLMIPSGQAIKEYKIFIPQLQIFYTIFNDMGIVVKNSRNEQQQNSHQFTCFVQQATTELNQVQSFKESKLISSLQANELNRFDLGDIQFIYNPYQDKNHNLQILINCSSNNSKSQLLYLINARTYKCQLGEFYIDEGCQICESIFGFYSVTYDATKCSIFDKTKFANISSNAIQLLEGYWRPNLYSDYTDYCFKNILFCKGGWKVGDELCSLGHLGGLCEECDYHNKRGEGNFFRNQQDSQCYNCSINNIMPFLFSFVWAIFSIVITLRSIEQSNLLFSNLQFKLIYRKILFKLEKDMSGIFIKMLFIYLWIFSAIFTFNIQFSISFSFIDQTSNTSQFMASSLDCYLSQLSQIDLIYLRIIATILLLLIQFVIILIGYQIYILISNAKFQTYILSNTLLYLYVSNFSGLIKQFCSIVSKRIISKIEYIQGDLTLLFGSLNHNQWIYKFAIPGLVLFGVCIPFALFLFMFLTKKRFNKIKFRRHICYLFDEYNESNYFWEQIKFSKKIIIILIMTYFESNILLKASLLGLLLLIYQIIAGKQQPYNLQKLNNLDLEASQICSLAIFIAISKYVSEQQFENASSQILQVFIIILIIKLCYQFILDIFRSYVKKYRIYFITILHNIFRSIHSNSKNTVYLGKLLMQWSKNEQRVQLNFKILKTHLLKISKAQIKAQKSFYSATSNQYRASLTRSNQVKIAKNRILLSLEQ
ncbi:unnamed protein product [Paramecium sonneborni]|uniref:Transmembrane protein n=1 Tax=Paramecium sonneborni TaxID=65129 RepID=A0A8S1RK45_9CILI|nr:unnamed protein product [Paramecium sonneborni]